MIDIRVRSIYYLVFGDQLLYNISVDTDAFFVIIHSLSEKRLLFGDTSNEIAADIMLESLNKVSRKEFEDRLSVR